MHGDSSTLKKDAFAVRTSSIEPWYRIGFEGRGRYLRLIDRIVPLCSDAVHAKRTTLQRTRRSADVSHFNGLSIRLVETHGETLTRCCSLQPHGCCDESQ